MVNNFQELGTTLDYFRANWLLEKKDIFMPCNKEKPSDWFHCTVLFSISFCLYRACFTHLISSNLSCNLCLWYYDQLVHFDKEINANVYRHSLWEYCKHFHCSFEWHLTPHMTLSIKTCIRRIYCIN